VDTGEHLLRCLAYIDLNMVRAGVVTHPVQWEASGYKEIQNHLKSYAVIDRTALASLIALTDVHALAAAQSRWIDDGLRANADHRQPAWSESLAVAVGRESFVEIFRRRLGIGANCRQVREIDGKPSVFYLSRRSSTSTFPASKRAL
jgi:putative transposase